MNTIGLDIGTSSVKALLVSASGEVLKVSAPEYPFQTLNHFGRKLTLLYGGMRPKKPFDSYWMGKKLRMLVALD